ncbi:MAG: hypothetical protein A4E62_01126 [Syntrophorhabdus sp. PtaU1.Bin002]|nr:MAG: hypothetical protein A4E62_01126 [Syntrophorhabdus sp. PtaU1.Bin002]
MLNHGFSAAEGSRYTGRASLGHGEKHINDALTRYKGKGRHQLSCDGTGLTNRPPLHHGNRDVTLQGFKNRDLRIHVTDKGPDLHNLPDYAGGHHDLVKDELALLYRPQHIAGYDFIPYSNGRSKRPLPVPVQCGSLRSTNHVISKISLKGIERTLHTIVNRADQPRTEFYA